ncbi:MAG: hypothetical protein ACTSV2_06930 [Candidatus Thorarchaeota archaeon]
MHEWWPSVEGIGLCPVLRGARDHHIVIFNEVKKRMSIETTSNTECKFITGERELPVYQWDDTGESIIAILEIIHQE